MTEDFDLDFLNIDFKKTEINSEKLKEVKQVNEVNVSKLKAMPENLGDAIYDYNESENIPCEVSVPVKPQVLVPEFNFEADQLQQEYTFLRTEILKLIDKSNLILDKIIEYSDEEGMLKGGMVLAFGTLHSAISNDIKLLSQLPQRYQQIKKVAIGDTSKQIVPINNGIVNNNTIYVAGSSQNILDNLDELINRTEGGLN